MDVWHTQDPNKDLRLSCSVMHESGALLLDGCSASGELPSPQHPNPYPLSCSVMHESGALLLDACSASGEQP